jgi:hypothetical protein
MMYKELMFDRPYYGTPEHYYNEYLRNHAKKQNKGSGTKDSERAKCYSAEWAFQSRCDKLIPKFKDIGEAQKFAKRIYKSKTWQKIWMEKCNQDITALFNSNPAVVAKQRSSGRGTAGWSNGHSVTLDTRVGLDAYTLIHELTHCLRNMHHGRSFRKDLLVLVSRFLGREAAKVLKEEFKSRKLAFGEARKPMTFEQWQTARLRMQKVRNG